MDNHNLAGGESHAPSESIPKNEIAPGALPSQPPPCTDLAQAAPGCPGSGGVPGAPAASYVYAPKPATPAPFTADKKDALFALVFFLLGYLFLEWCFLFSAFSAPYQILLYLDRYPPYRVFWYVLLYVGVVLSYVYLRGRRPTRESWFWLGVMLCLGGPLYLFPDYYRCSLLGNYIQFFLLIPVAAYWTLCACGALYEGAKTSNWVVLDMLSALAFVPLGNLWCQPRALARGARGTVTGRSALYVALGLLLSVPLLGLVLPSLFAADTHFTEWFSSLLSFFFPNNFLGTLFFSIPVSLFLFGLCHGGLYRRHTEVIRREDIRTLGTALRLVPSLAAVTALGLVCAVYLLFILFQGGYLFSAFSGRLPESFTFSEYAREGFFELCRVSGVNVVFLLGANLLCKVPHVQSKALRGLNLTLSALTLLLLATAGSKMALYIAAHGLTPLRVLSSVFLLWLATVFVLVIIWQFRPIAPVRLAVLIGAVLVALMCALPVMPGIEAYNNAYHPQAPYASLDQMRWLLAPSPSLR